jgi:hypothetical protein
MTMTVLAGDGEQYLVGTAEDDRLAGITPRLFDLVFQTERALAAAGMVLLDRLAVNQAKTAVTIWYRVDGGPVARAVITDAVTEQAMADAYAYARLRDRT